ncbi:MAG: hypothetical protein HQ488_00305 [Parcubacteria group bacterium]|nr:hypothetical protein [Parcubacteria group bacterium]
MSKPLTIARGLRRAKQVQGRVAEMRARLLTTTSWQKDQKPEFTFDETLASFDAAVDELVSLRTAIARANATATVQFGDRSITLAEAIRQQAELKGRITLFQSLGLRQGEERVHVGYDERSRPTHEVVVYEAVWTERQRAEQIEGLRARLETLGELLEEANHTTRLEL